MLLVIRMEVILVTLEEDLEDQAPVPEAGVMELEVLDLADQVR